VGVLGRTHWPSVESLGVYKFVWLEYRYGPAVPVPHVGHGWIRANVMQMSVATYVGVGVYPAPRVVLDDLIAPEYCAGQVHCHAGPKIRQSRFWQ